MRFWGSCSRTEIRPPTAPTNQRDHISRENRTYITFERPSSIRKQRKQVLHRCTLGDPTVALSNQPSSTSVGNTSPRLEDAVSGLLLPVLASAFKQDDRYDRVPALPQSHPLDHCNEAVGGFRLRRGSAICESRAVGMEVLGEGAATVVGRMPS